MVQKTGFKQSMADIYFFMQGYKNSFTTVLIYVDDMITDNDSADIEPLKGFFINNSIGRS